MATAYHLEALRRQRLIDRTIEAKRRLDEKKLLEEQAEQDRPPSRQAHRPKSASSVGSRQEVAQEVERPSSAQSKQSQTSRPGTAESQKHSVNGSRPTSAASQQHAGGSRSTTAASSKQSQQSVTEGRPESGQLGSSTSRPGSCTSRTGSKVSKRSSRTGSSGKSSELAIVEKELHEEEKVLHDSNLVRGYIDPKQELEERAASRPSLVV